MIPPSPGTLLRRVLAHPEDHRALSGLIAALIVMARAMLRSSFRRQAVTAAFAGYSEQDVAIRAIEDLVLPRGGNPCHELRVFFSGPEWDADLLADEQILIGLRMLLHRKMSQTVAEIAGEADPRYRRILRNVHDTLRRHPEWWTRELFNETVVFRLPAERARLQLPALPVEEAVGLLLGRSVAAESFDRIVQEALACVEEDGRCRAAWSVPDLCVLLKEYFFLLRDGITDDGRGTTAGLESFEVRDLADRAATDVAATVLARQRRDGTMTEEDAARIGAAMRDMLGDLVEKQPRRLYDYYVEHVSAVTNDEYRTNGRARFEYVMRAARDRFIALCADRLA